MLALVFRGVFLVGVLSWYSTNVWKMIDTYFKDRFQNYLQEEFKKNPKMRADINSYAAGNSDKKGIDFINQGTLMPAPEGRQMEEFLESKTSSVDVLTTAVSLMERAELAKDAGENGVKATVDKNAFQESLDMSTERKEKPNPTGNDGFEKRSAAKIEKEKERREDISHEERETREKKRRSIIQLESKGERSKKRKIKTITLTEADFESATRFASKDDDFSEFDLEDKLIKEREEGVSVTDLPSKPKADIGDLETVTADEFCPLTLDEEATCGIPTKWP